VAGVQASGGAPAGPSGDRDDDGSGGPSLSIGDETDAALVVAMAVVLVGVLVALVEAVRRDLPRL
jgi:hypothetical protein